MWPQERDYEKMMQHLPGRPKQQIKNFYNNMKKQYNLPGPWKRGEKEQRAM